MNSPVVAVRLSPDDHAELRRRAAREGVTVTTLVREAIAWHLAHLDAQPPRHRRAVRSVIAPPAPDTGPDLDLDAATYPGEPAPKLKRPKVKRNHGRRSR